VIYSVDHSPSPSTSNLREVESGWKSRDTWEYLENVGTHNPEVNPNIWEDMKTHDLQVKTFRKWQHPRPGSEDPRSKSCFPPYPEKTNFAPQYKYRLTFKYSLAEIIVIKGFIYILSKRLT